MVPLVVEVCEKAPQVGGKRSERGAGCLVCGKNGGSTSMQVRGGKEPEQLAMECLTNDGHRLALAVLRLVRSGLAPCPTIDFGAGWRCPLFESH